MSDSVEFGCAHGVVVADSTIETNFKCKTIKQDTLLRRKNKKREPVSECNIFLDHLFFCFFLHITTVHVYLWTWTLTWFKFHSNIPKSSVCVCALRAHIALIRAQGNTDSRAYESNERNDKKKMSRKKNKQMIVAVRQYRLLSLSTIYNKYIMWREKRLKFHL